MDSQCSTCVKTPAALGALGPELGRGHVLRFQLTSQLPVSCGWEHGCLQGQAGGAEVLKCGSREPSLPHTGGK